MFDYEVLVGKLCFVKNSLFIALQMAWVLVNWLINVLFKFMYYVVEIF